MRIVLLVVAALATPVSGLAQDAPKPQEIRLQAELKAQSRTPGERRYGVDVTGTCSLPDDIWIVITVTSKADRISDAGELLEGRGRRQTQTRSARRQKFRLSFMIFEPGIYDVAIEIPTRDQPAPPMTEDLKKSLALKSKWSFQYEAWDVDLPERLAAGYPDVRALLLEARKLVDTLEAATATEDRWLDLGKGVRDRIMNLADRVEAAQVSGGIYPGTLFYLRDVLRSLDRISGRFYFQDGKLVPEPLAKDPSGRGVWWDGLRGAFDEALSIAAREYALWSLRLFRACGEPNRPAVKGSLEKVTVPELRDWTDRLLKLEAGDDVLLEKELRAASLGAGKK